MCALVVLKIWVPELMIVNINEVICSPRGLRQTLFGLLCFTVDLSPFISLLFSAAGAAPV
jgi:hypothetical protein